METTSTPAITGTEVISNGSPKIDGQVYRVFVIDNRVRLYKGKDMISYHECDNHNIACEEAANWQKEYNTDRPTVYGPVAKVSANKARHNEYLAHHPEAAIEKPIRVRKVRKIALIQPIQSREEISKKQEQDFLKLALLEGKTVLQIKQEMGVK